MKAKVLDWSQPEEPGQDEILKYIRDNGILNLPDIEQQIMMKKRQEYIKQHPYKVWQNEKGFYCTHFPKEGARDGRTLVKRKEKKDLYDYIAKFWKDREENPVLDEVFEEYNQNRRELQKVTEATIWRDKMRYKRYFSEFGKRKIRTIEREDVEDFLESLIPKFTLTAKEFSAVKGIVRGIFKRARRRKLTDIEIVQVLQELDVSDHRFRPRIIDDEKEVFFDDELKKIIEYTYTHPRPVNTGIALLLATGIRIGELSTLKKEDFSDYSFKVCRTETRYESVDNPGTYIYEVKNFPKTKAGYRTVIIPKQFHWILDRLKLEEHGSESEYVFSTSDGRMKNSTFAKQIRRINKKLGITQKSANKFRKTYCSILLDNHIDNKTIEKQVGHADTKVTETNYHRDRKSSEQKLEVFSSIPEFTEVMEPVTA